MKQRFRIKTALAAAILTLTIGLADLGAQPVSEVEVTADGLHRIDPAVLDLAWLNPDVDLGSYTHAFVLPTIVLFRDLPAPSHSAWADSTRTTFPVSERMQKRLRETFGESFHKAMAASRDYEMADRLGRNVVLIRGYLTDVATGVPPDLPGSNTGAIRWVWEGNLVLELRDSMSDAVLLRIFNRHRVEGPVEAERVWSLAPSVTGQWSRLMVDQLAKVTDFYPSRLQRMQEQARDAAE
ncbi:MAG TPA: hypothetical protein VLD39_05280 [Gammaproteobacteria bacterium]|nr:hypothetical protein [Gammaproteobacteria bacterium]